MSILLSLLLIIISATILGKFVERFKIPNVVGQLLAGIILGPACLNWLVIDHTLATFAEIGVVLLMFIAGLECNLSLLKKYLSPAILVGCFGVIVPLLSFYLVGIYLVQLNSLAAIFLGLIFSATSVSISAAVLAARKKLASVPGSVILGAAVVDDIIVIMLLSVLTSFTSKDSLNFATFSFWWTFIGLKVVFFIVFFLVWHLFQVKFETYYQKIQFAYKTALIPLILCFAGAYFAELTSMSDVIGAFLSGLILSTQKNKVEMIIPIETISYSLFVPVFFATIGLKLNLTGLLAQWPTILLLTSLAFATKMLGSYLASRGTKLTHADSLIVSIGMISRGEMALIIVEIGGQLNLLSDSFLSLSVLVIIFTTVCSPLLLNKYLAKSVLIN